MANVVSFPAVETPRIRVVLTHRPGAASGLTELEAWGNGPLPLAPAEAPVRNLAMTGRISASYTSPYDDVAQVADGRIAFTHYSRNRWTAYQSPNPSDWLMVEWDAPQRVARVDLYLWGDGQGVDAPAAYRIERWDGTAWAPVAVAERLPQAPTTWARNTTRFEPVETARLRVVFQHAQRTYAGVTELEVWAEH